MWGGRGGARGGGRGGLHVARLQLLRDEAIEVWNAVRQDRGMKPAETA